MSEHNGGGGGAPRLRLGDHDDWLPVEVAQRIIDIMWQRERPRLAGLLGEAMTGDRPTATRASRQAAEQ